MEKKENEKVVLKVKHYPYEKENLKNPQICKVCGLNKGIYGLVGGICMSCHNKANTKLTGDKKGFVWDTKKQEL